MFNQYPDIMSVFDVAEALYIGKNRVYELLELGQLKGFRIGHVWKIPRKSVEEYVLSQSGLK
ncbi:MAG: helix-turn-helix domain-containing protein [Lachnospira sp.]|nr:helix-turn-helix domain-containing protein [Lachnospira sp.]